MRVTNMKNFTICVNGTYLKPKESMTLGEKTKSQELLNLLKNNYIKMEE